MLKSLNFGGLAPTTDSAPRLRVLLTNIMQHSHHNQRLQQNFGAIFFKMVYKYR